MTIKGEEERSVAAPTAMNSFCYLFSVLLFIAHRYSPERCHFFKTGTKNKLFVVNFRSLADLVVEGS